MAEDKKTTTGKRKPKGEIKYKFSLNEEQKRVKEDIFNSEIVVINSKAGSGKTACVAMSVLDLLFKKEITSVYVSRPTVEVGVKLGFLPGAQPYYSKILTPNGWTTMGEIKEGDEVFAFDGTVTKVIGTYEHGVRSTYEITTLQGKRAITCDKHLWEIQESNYKNKKNNPITVNTEYIKNNIYNKYGGYKIVLPEHQAVEFKEREISLDPYLIGVLLGDGSISSSGVSFSSVDSDIIDRIQDITESYDMSLIKGTKNSINYYFKSYSENNKPARTLIVKDINGNTTKYKRIGDFIKQHPEFNRGRINLVSKTGEVYKDKFFQFLNDADFSTNFIKNELNKIGLIGKKSTEKFIPDVYKYNTYENRLNLLQGLLDTDGGIKKNGNVYFTTTSQLLRDDIIELIQSLGGRAVYYERDRRGKKSKYEGKYINTKHISYEVNISFREFPDIFHLRRKKERLLKNSNLHKDRVKSVEYVGEEKVKCIKIEHPSQLYITDNYIVTHNTADEKLNPYLDAFKEALFDCYDKEKVLKHLQNGDIKGDAIQFIRGKNFGAGEVLVVDEIQNASVSEVYAILTRLAKGGRIILIGDINQVDTRESYTGLHYVIDMAKRIEEIKLHSLKQNHRSDLVAKIIDYEYSRKKQ